MSKRLTYIVSSAFPLAIAFVMLLAFASAVGAQRAEKAAVDENTAGRLPETEPLKRYSPEAVRAEFAALKKEDVAWRKIDWKTCLLDGLNASREQHKPIMLWIFIDRPIDDERC